MSDGNQESSPGERECVRRTWAVHARGANSSCYRVVPDTQAVLLVLDFEFKLVEAKRIWAPAAREVLRFDKRRQSREKHLAEPNSSTENLAGEPTDIAIRVVGC